MTFPAYVHQQCQLDPRCEYGNGHHCECTPVEIGQHVLKLRTDAYSYAFKERMSCILRKVHADWLDALIQEGTSPLLTVGWVSVRKQSSYKAQTAGTWHRDRDCKRNRAMGMLQPKLRLEITEYGGIRPCPGCGKFTDDEMDLMQADYRRKREMQREATEGLCHGRYYGSCGRDVVPGKTTCANHAQLVSAFCYEGDHVDCPKVLATHTRQDGGTYTTDCACHLCTHPKV